MSKDNVNGSILQNETVSSVTDKKEIEQKTLQAYEKFKQATLDQNINYPDPEPVVYVVQNGIEIPLLTLNSFSLWQGKQKSKKTTCLALAIGGFLRGSDQIVTTGFRAAKDGIVLYFDTEQGQSYAARTMKLILKIASVNSSNKLIYIDLREYTPPERFEIIKAGIANTKNCILIIIDGMVDLMNDFMDAKEAHSIITDILKLCSIHNIHIAGVLHQNKGDKNARAHVGSIASQKCEIEIATEVDTHDRNQSIVSCLNSRGLPFEDFAIRWDKGELPQIVETWKAMPVKKKINPQAFDISDTNTILESVFKTTPKQTHSELLIQIKLAVRSLGKEIGDNKAREFITHYLNEKLITREGTFRTKSCFYSKT